ncbi:hypothetical protein Pan258_10050 [Symmachiella dynata]|uniref:imm11 family protein n=1 Tax=Symmachiella dynata TaxID=2527995 RepID=UPI001187E5E0|nr:DUF1629 domain-containing protein [Symmachiella dynata]QDT46980.1 hypothetical protein Pan258_10050 [Symmachiella dynata]
MVYYVYEPASDDYGAVSLSRDAGSRLIDAHLDDERVGDTWDKIVFDRYDDDLNVPSDFPCFSNYTRVPLMSARAWDAISDMVGDYCEPLPVVMPSGEECYFVHVMLTVDALDESRSEISYNNTTGRISRVYRYVFNSPIPQDIHLFKLPIHRGSELVYDSHFKSLVEENDLKGLLHTELPM